MISPQVWLMLDLDPDPDPDMDPDLDLHSGTLLDPDPVRFGLLK